MPIFATNAGSFSPLSVKGIHATGSVADFLIENSLRFDKDADSTLTRSITTTGSQTKFTLSCWVKPSHDYDYTYLIGVSSSFSLYWTNTQKLHAEMYSSDGSSWAVISDTQAIFPDVAAWYHVVATVDSSAGTTNADRFKIWVNGVQQTIDFTTYWDGLITGPLRHLNESGQTHQINSRPGATYHSSFYLAEYHYLDGISVTSPTDFGEFDATTGIWTPIEYTGVYNAAQVGDGIVYSSGVSSPDGTIAAAPNDGTALFDGGITTNCQTTTAGTTVRWTPPTTVSWSTSLRVYTGPYSGSVVVRSNGTDYTLNTNGTQVASPYWLSHPNSSGTIDYIDAQGHIGAGVGYMKAIEVDGVILQDGAPAGVNGCYLNFSNSSNVGEDQAGSNDFTASGISAYGDATITTFEGNQTNPTTPVTSITGPDGYSHYAFFNLTNNSGQHIFYHQANNSTSTWFFSDSGHTYQATHSTQQGGNTLGYRSSTAEYENHVSTHGTFATANGTTSGYANDNPAGGISGGTVTGLNTTNAVNVWKFVVDMTNHKVWIDPGTGSYAGGGDPSNTSSTATFEIPDADLKFWSVPYASSSTNTIYSGSDTMKDSPMNGNPSTDTGLGGELSSNYATLNPFRKGTSITISNGNLDLVSSGSHGHAFSTIGVSSGKWYWEYTTNNTYAAVGIAEDDSAVINAPMGDNPGSWGYVSNGTSSTKQAYPVSSHAAYGSALAVGDVLGAALDLDNGTLTFYKNGSSMGTAYTGLDTTLTYFVIAGDSTSAGNPDGSINFGQVPFSNQAPSGFKCLCAANLPDPAISDGTTALSIVEWDGVDGTADTVSGLNLVNDPGFIWTKATNHGYHNNLWDIVRGYNLTNALITDYNGAAVGGKITSVTPSSFSHDGGVWFNENTRKYVAWAWDAGSTTSTIAAGGSNSLAYDQSQNFSGNTSNPTGSYGNASNAFDGNLSTHASPSYGNEMTYTNPSPSSYVIDTFEIYIDIYDPGVTVELNGTSIVSQLTTTEKWYTISGFEGQNFSTLKWGPTSGNLEARLKAVKVNGIILVDQGTTPAVSVPERECIVRANQTAGFSVVRVDDPNATEGRVHGLTKAPEFIIAKATATLSENWHTFHSAFGKSHYAIFGTSGYSQSDQWGSQEPNSHSFYVKTNTGSGANYAGGMIYYIWHSVPGFSAFGSFEGTDLDPGPFVYLGFKPALILLKNGDATGDWIMHDTTRSPYNEAYKFLRPNSSAAENTTADNQSIDILSNGFRIKGATSTNDAINGPNNTITYCAWAEHPFKQSLAS